MSAPQGNQNRKGKTGISYQLSNPKLMCDSCKAKDLCPLFQVGKDCAIIKRVRKYKIDTLDDIRATRKMMLLDLIAQLQVRIMMSQFITQGSLDKDTLKAMNDAINQLAQLERDEFNQRLKSKQEEGSSILGGIIKEIMSKPSKALPEPAIDIPFTMYEIDYADPIKNTKETS